MQGLYQWLSEQASFLRYAAIRRGAGRIVRTQMTIRREGMTLLIGSAEGFDICPLCGQKMVAVPPKTNTNGNQNKKMTKTRGIE